MIRAIIFDCFGVLYHSSIDELYRLCPVERHDRLHDVRLQRDRGYLNHEDYLLEVSKLLDRNYEEVRNITEESHIRNQELIDFIQSVDRSRYKIGMLSNIGDSVIEHLFNSKELSELFDQVVLSYRVGMIKPDPAIFHLTAKRLEVLPAECVMVDDIEENCAGAIAIGMHAVHHKQTRATLNKLAGLINAN